MSLTLETVFGPQENNAPQPPSLPVQHSSIESETEKFRLVTTIAKCLKDHPAALEGFVYSREDLLAKSTSELSTLFSLIRYTIGTYNCSGNIDKSVFDITLFIERMISMMGIDLNGLTHVLRDDPDTTNCIRELELEFCEMLYVRPEMRLLKIALVKTQAVYKFNAEKNRKLITETLKQPVPQDLIDAYKDL
jgi:hypothetical protein